MAYIYQILNNLNPFYGLMSISAAILANSFFGLSTSKGLKKLSVVFSVTGIAAAAFLLIYSYVSNGIFSTMVIAFEGLHLMEAVLLLFISLNILILLTEYKIKEHNFIQIIIIFLFSTVSVLFLVLSRNFLAIFVALALFTLANFQLISGIQGRKNPIYVIKFFLNSSLSVLFLFIGFSFLYGATDFKNLQQVMESGALANPFLAISLIFIVASAFSYMFFYPLHGNYIKLIKHSDKPVLPLVLFYFLPAGLIMVLKFRALIYHFMSGSGIIFSSAILFLAAVCILGPAIAALSTKSLKRIISYTYLSFMGLAVLGFGLLSEGILDLEGLNWLVLFNLFNLVVCFLPAWLIISKLDDSIYSLKGLVSQNKYIGINLIIVLLSWMGIAGTSGFLLRYRILGPYFEQIRDGGFFRLSWIKISSFSITSIAFLMIAAVTLRLMIAMLKKKDKAAAPFFGIGYNIYISFFTILILFLGILGLFNIIGLSIFPWLDITRLDFLTLPS